ncbi:hypothetical protein [Acinetobacter sp.]|uniref:hypothetical protein n=1 Tax=Acinetobacter sp. TaxID=472 RepID=UPI0035B036D6
MSKIYLIRRNVSRTVRGQDNISKVMFHTALYLFWYMTEFATDKWFWLLFPKEK